MRKSNGIRSARKAMSRADGIAFEELVSEHDAANSPHEKEPAWHEKTETPSGAAEGQKHGGTARSAKTAGSNDS